MSIGVVDGAGMMVAMPDGAVASRDGGGAVAATGTVPVGLGVAGAEAVGGADRVRLLRRTIPGSTPLVGVERWPEAVMGVEVAENILSCDEG